MNIPPLLQQARTLFPAQLHDRIFLVGGAVRDLLLDRASADLDLVVALPVDELLRSGFRPVAPKTAVPIFLRHDDRCGKIEATRIDDSSRLVDDLARRDFTVNAMALDLRGTLHDPLGGQADLQARQLRACTDDSFSADPTRIFRALRFEADGWCMTAATAELIQGQDWEERLTTQPVERFSNELIKALALPQPAIFFERMLACGVGRTLLPELFRMPAIPAGPLEHHPEGDLFTHCRQVLERLCPLNTAPLARFCAFFHDLGKLATDPACYPKHHGHDESGAQLAPAFCNRLALPAAWRKALVCICRYHGSANRWDETRDSTRIRIADAALKAQVETLLPQIAAADYPAGPGLADWALALAAARATTTELGLDPAVIAQAQPQDRFGLLMQRRVALLRARRDCPPETV